MEQCSRILPVMLNLRMLHVLSIMLYKFNILFISSHLNYKITNISSLCGSSTVQHTINYSSTYAYKINTLNSFLLHSQTLINAYFDKSSPKIHQFSQSCEKCTFYTNFVNCADNSCLLRWDYAQYFYSPIILKTTWTL